MRPIDADGAPGIRFWVLDGVDEMAGIELVARTSRRFTVPCRLAGAQHDLRVRWIEGRGQVDARLLLRDLELASPDTAGTADNADTAEVQVGVIQHDMAIPVFTHVFGLARHHGHTAVVSLARLRPEFYGLPPDPALVLQRAARETAHELGHVLGLGHCDDFDCIMHFAADVEHIDLRGDTFCPHCAAQLPAGWVRDRTAPSPSLPPIHD
jgi:archaemetzincin